MGGHHRAIGATDEWYTPPAIFEALGIRFDLDPCAPAGGLPWIPADRFLCMADDGLSAPWDGRVWCNPPYGKATAPWLRRMAAHGNGIALVFARTDTAWFHEVAGTATAICFLAGRVNFVPQDPSHVAPNRTNSSSGAPSMLLAWGDECALAVAAAGLGLTFAVRAPSAIAVASLFDTAPA